MTPNSDLASNRVFELDSSSLYEIVMGAPVTFVTGKGGVGKTTLASLLSREAHSHGERVLFISLNQDSITNKILGITDGDVDKDTFRSKNLGFDVSVITPTSALANYLASKHMGSITKKLQKVGLLEMVANTVPGMRELLVLGDIRSKADSGKWDRIIVDSPSTGHARSLFNIHKSTNLIANSGVVSSQSQAARDFLKDPNKTQVVVATLDHVMPLSEAKEFLFELEDDLEIRISAVVINKSNVAKTKNSIGVNKNFKDIYIPIFSYPDQNKKYEKKRFFTRFKTKHHTFENVATKFNFPKKFDTLITLGSGGVGKTTTAASIALALSQQGKNVALLTIDPARRLGIALGLTDPTLSESHLDSNTLSTTSQSESNLHVFQLDTNQEFLRLLKETLSDSEFEEIENNTFVSAVSQMGIVNEFMAIEAMHRLVNTAEYEIVVIDTPPSHHVFDLLEAPKALERMTNSKIFKTIVNASGVASITTNMALGTILRPLKGIVGTQLITDAIEFMRTLKEVEEKFTQHCVEVTKTLEKQETMYAIICNPSTTSTEQASNLVKGMISRGYSNVRLIINGVDYQDDLTTKELEQLASRMQRFEVDTTIFEEIELDNPLDIVKTIASNVDFET